MTGEERGAWRVDPTDSSDKDWTRDPPWETKGKEGTTRVRDWVQEDIGRGRMVKPFQQPHPPIAVSAMSPYSGMMRLAAHRADDHAVSDFERRGFILLVEALVAQMRRALLEPEEPVPSAIEHRPWSREVEQPRHDLERRRNRAKHHGHDTHSGTGRPPGSAACWARS